MTAAGIWRALGGVWIAAAGFSLAGCGDDAPPPLPPGPTAAEVATAIDRSAQHLASMVRDNGQFIYEANLDPAAPPKASYNMVRHAGTVFAMAQAYRRSPDPELLERTRLAGVFLRSQIDPLPELDRGAMALVSRPHVVSEQPGSQAKLGGSALALAGLLRLEKIAPGDTPAATLIGLGRFLLAMQTADGSFHNNYLPDVKKIWDPAESLYYPGEAALALVMLFEHTQDPAFLEGATRALLRLGLDRQDWSIAEIPPDHWALLATAEVLPRVDDPAKRAVILGHARQVARSIVNEQITRSDKPGVTGSFDLYGRTTPTSTRLEGLLAALLYLGPEEDAVLRRDVQAAINRGMRLLIDAQVQEGPWIGAMPHTAVVQREMGLSSTGLRIDYDQHFLSAAMQYEALLAARN